MRPDETTSRTAPETYSGTYSVVARRFHWCTVALIAVQLPLGVAMTKYAEATNFASPAGLLYDLHKVLGMSILALIIARLWYRFSYGAPADEPTLEPWQKIVSHITHWSIYGLLLVVPALGWLATSAYGPFAPFGIKLPNLLAQNDALATRLYGWHEIAGKLLLVLVFMHIGAALFHYFIRRDGVLNRMWTALPRRDGR